MSNKQGKRERSTDIDVDDDKDVQIKKKKKKGKIIPLFIFIVIAGLVAFGTYTFLDKVKDNGGGIGGVISTVLGHDEATKEQLPRINFLLLGESENMTDTIIVCSYYPKIDEISMLSIPRDTFVGWSYDYASPSDKINSIYIANDEDPIPVVEEIEELLEIDIPYYIVVDTEAVRELVDVIGGVWFDVPIDMEYDAEDLPIRLNAGYQLIDGNKAEQLLRFRHNNDGSSYPDEYGTEDIGRMRTGQEFLKEAAKQAIKAENLLKIDNFIKIAEKYVKTNMNFWELKDYVPYLSKIDMETIRKETLPGVPALINEFWFYEYNYYDTQEIVQDLFLKTKKEVVNENGNVIEDVDTSEVSENSIDRYGINSSSKGVKLEVLNGSSDKDALTELTQSLKNKGYEVVRSGNTVSTEYTEVINRSRQGENSIEDLLDALGFDIEIETGAERSNVDFTIIIGEDY